MLIKVLIVDDSIVFRKILQEALNRHPEIRVVGSAANGKEALRLIRTHRPHLLVLDVEMPELDGLETLDEIRRQRLDAGVIMFSSLTSKGAAITLDALGRGAFDFVPKPTGTGAFAESVTRIKQDLIPKIKAYADTIKAQRLAGVRSPATHPRPWEETGRSHRGPAAILPRRSSASPRPPLPATRPRTAPARGKGARAEAVAIGVSTGGPNALNDVIPKFPAGFRLPIFLVQHMPPIFTAHLAKRLDEKSGVRVVEAENGQIVRPGTVYVAPGDYHMEVHPDGINRIIRLNQAPPVNSCRPSVDVLFHSIAKTYGPRTVAVIMTGMGQDGFQGCRELRTRGAVILAQDKNSCVVWGMPRFVTESGLADSVVPLSAITDSVLEFAEIPRRMPAEVEQRMEPLQAE